MKYIIRPGDQSYAGVTPPGAPISHAFTVKIQGAPYDYISAASPPQPVPAGTITHVTGAQMLKISTVDKNGTNWSPVLGAMRAGDVIIIDAESYTLAGSPVASDGQWNMPVVGVPTTVTGTYLIEVMRP
jgi:hypothetical protein